MKSTNDQFSKDLSPRVISAIILQQMDESELDISLKQALISFNPLDIDNDMQALDLRIVE